MILTRFFCFFTEIVRSTSRYLFYIYTFEEKKRKNLYINQRYTSTFAPSSFILLSSFISQHDIFDPQHFEFLHRSGFAGFHGFCFYD